MGRLFNMDNPFFRFMGRVADLIILNVIFLLCCVPIVTIGPALTALFYVTLKIVRDEDSYIVKGFFHSFKQNLKQGIIINLIMLATLALLWFDMRIVRTGMAGNLGNIMGILLGVLAIFYMMLFIYIYPVLSKFYNSIKNTFVNSILMSIRHLPYTVLMIAVSLSPLLLLLLPEQLAFIQSVALFILFMMGFSLIALINSYFLAKIFDNYIPKEEMTPDEEFTVALDETPEVNGGSQPFFDPTPIFRDEPAEEPGNPEEKTEPEETAGSGEESASE